MEAGLPSITGSFGHLGVSSFGKGAFTKVTFNSGWGNFASGNGNGTVSFDASRSSTIYGASDTVTPPSVTCHVCMKY